MEHQWEPAVITDLGGLTEVTQGAEPLIADTDLVGIGSV